MTEEEEIYYKDKIKKIKKRFNVDIPPHSILDGNIILYNLCKDPTLIFLISKSKCNVFFVSSM